MRRGSSGLAAVACSSASRLRLAQTVHRKVANARSAAPLFKRLSRVSSRGALAEARSKPSPVASHAKPQRTTHTERISAMSLTLSGVDQQSLLLQLLRNSASTQSSASFDSNSSSSSSSSSATSNVTAASASTVSSAVQAFLAQLGNGSTTSSQDGSDGGLGGGGPGGGGGGPRGPPCPARRRAIRPRPRRSCQLLDLVGRFNRSRPAC